MLKKFLFTIFGASLCVTFSLLSAEVKETEQKITYAPLPKEKEGAYPIHMPTYEGVEQILLLSNSWVVVVTSNIQETIDKINELSKGKFLEDVNIWEKSKKTNYWDWTVYRRQIEPTRELYLAEARELTGEKKLGDPDYFEITSTTDPQYAQPEHPLRVTRNIVSTGEGQFPGWHEVDYNQYSYLELPFPLQQGNTYTITLQNGKKVTFLYDELRTVSRAIKVNQVGYLTDAPKKYAYLGAYLYEFGPLDFSNAKEFSVISVETGQPVLHGEIKLRAKNPHIAPRNDGDDINKQPLFSGEDIYELDLSGLKNEGEFFITIPGVGRSWTFRNGKDTYGEAFYIQARALFHQRCGIAIDKTYSAWTRKQCHTEPVYESDSIPFAIPMKGLDHYDVFDVIGASIDYTHKTDDARGGWHDAADWDRGLAHYADIFDLLGAYELAPDKFYDGQLHIPESSNGIPDILDEAEYGLLVWKKSMQENGGVAGVVETWTHPRMDDPNIHYAFSKRTRAASLIYATAAAQYAYLVAPYNAEKAAEYKESALKAYAFGINPKNSIKDMTIHAAQNRGQGEKYTLNYTEDDNDLIPYLISSKLRLFILTDDAEYLEGLPDLIKRTPKPYVWPFSYKDASPWLYYGVFSTKVAEKMPTLSHYMLKYYTDPAEDFYKEAQNQYYRHSWPLSQDYWMSWGATTMTNKARALLIAYHLTKNKKYREAAITNADFMLGANPMGMSWTTGLGYVYPINIQHAVSEYDGIKDPVPGIAIYGITEGVPNYFENMLWKTKRPDGTMDLFLKRSEKDMPIWRKWSMHPHLNVPQNEFTIAETISGAIFTYAMLMPEGWMPDEQLKNRKPRQDDLLFGLWYLP